MKCQRLPLHVKQSIEEMYRSNTFSKNTIYEITKNMNYYAVETLIPYANKHNSVIQSIKMLVLMHNIIFSDSKKREQNIQKVIRTVQPRIENSKNYFEVLLLQKLIIPYKVYLLKRNIWHEKDVGKETQPYILINLMQTSLSFINIIFTLGRYLLKKYPFLNQFNIIIAKDLAMLYRKLKMKMAPQFSAQHLEVIQNLNENLFTVFYNCYFNRSVSVYAPSWIDTDKINSLNEEENTKTNLMKKKMTKSYKQFQRVSFEANSQVNSSICLEISSSTVHDFKSFSTIASHREMDKEETSSEKEIKERLDFIAAASMLLGELKQQEEEEDPISSELPVY